MKILKTYGKSVLIILAAVFSVIMISYIRTVTAVPNRLMLLEGEEYIYDFKSPFSVSIKADRSGVIILNNGEIKSEGNYLRLSNPITLKTQKNGSVNLNMRLFGLIPFKTMQVDIVPNKKIIACGNTVGVKIRINGILVIGVSDVEARDGRRIMPSRDSGIKAGDLLIEINNIKPGNIDELIREIDSSNGKIIKLKYKRGNAYNDAEIKPVISIDDKKYHIGLWVRDSTAGIGTLTFYDPETRSFGALGHGITDIDTGTLMPVDTGEILESNILAIKKGQQGNPGELKGVFIEDRNKLGIVKLNTDCGIYGILNNEARNRISDRRYPIALRNQIKEGHATILANIEGKTVKEYNIEIQKISRQNMSGSKGMIIKITDKRLLDSTGGIVQGMSGSPIIQNGRIIGAVTHVLVNDPTRGYGIYIEWMIKNVAENSVINSEKAS